MPNIEDSTPESLLDGLGWHKRGYPEYIIITGYIGAATEGSIPNSINKIKVTEIGDNAFKGWTGLTSISLPAGLTTIGDSAFEGCTGLTSISIPASVTSIGAYAFHECTNLTNISLPAGLASIGNLVFWWCTKLITFAVESGNGTYGSIDGVLFNKARKTLVVYPVGKTDSIYSIPTGVTSIENNAFSKCKNLTNIKIPAGVTSIGYNAFEFCTGVTVFDVNPSNTAYRSIDGVLFDKTGKTIVAYPAGKTDSTYSIPAGVTTIGIHAFNGCDSLTSITIPASVTNIAKCAFWWCTKLTSISLPAGLVSIGDQAFVGCNNLTSVSLSSKTEIGKETFPKGAQLTYIDADDGKEGE